MNIVSFDIVGDVVDFIIVVILFTVLMQRF